MDALLPVANVLGRLLSIFSLAYLMPIVAAILYEDGTVAEFIAAMGISLCTGLILYAVTRSNYRELKPRDGFLLVSTVWALMAAIATIPLLLVYDSMSFTDAFFETMSGLTTTGSTIMTDLDHAPPAINLWRHELNWLGGMGIIVLAVAVLPLLGVGGMQLYKAETPGPMKDSKLTARIADTAKALWFVYFLITVVCILLLNWAGLSWMPAACCMAVPAAGMKPDDSAVEPEGWASRSSNTQSTPASRRVRAATRPQAPAPTMATGMYGASGPGVPVRTVGVRDGTATGPV